MTEKPYDFIETETNRTLEQLKDVRVDVKERFTRQCMDCGSYMDITVFEDGTYDGGYYWSDLMLDGREYWECDDCYEKPPTVLEEDIPDHKCDNRSQSADSGWIERLIGWMRS